MDNMTTGQRIVGAAHGRAVGLLKQSETPECARQLEVPYRVRCLGDAVDELEKLAAVLNDRLSPVLASAPVNPEALTGCPSSTSLGGQIASAEDRVRAVARRLQDVLGQLEL
jgi:hypothetical protein